MLKKHLVLGAQGLSSTNFESSVFTWQKVLQSECRAFGRRKGAKAVSEDPCPGAGWKMVAANEHANEN